VAQQIGRTERSESGQNELSIAHGARPLRYAAL